MLLASCKVRLTVAKIFACKLQGTACKLQGCKVELASCKMLLASCKADLRMSDQRSILGFFSKRFIFLFGKCLPGASCSMDVG